MTTQRSREEANEVKNKRVWDLWRHEISDKETSKDLAIKYGKKNPESTYDFESMAARTIDTGSGTAGGFMRGGRYLET